MERHFSTAKRLRGEIKLFFASPGWRPIVAACCFCSVLLTSACSSRPAATEPSVQAQALAQGFSLSASPANVSFYTGVNGSTTITVGQQNGFDGNVTFSTAGLPSGLLATFSPPAAGRQSLLTLTSTNSVLVGIYSITIRGAAGTLQGSAFVTVTILPSPTFTLSASPASLSFNQGAGTSTTITVGSQNGFSGNVSFSTSGLPDGVQGTFNPPAAGQQSVLTLSSASTTPAGVYAITISGTAGSVQDSASVTVTILPSIGVSLSASSSGLTVDRGAGSSLAIMVEEQNGFAGTVALSVAGLPTGVHASFQPSSLHTSGSSMLTLSVAHSAPPGTYALMASGTTGSVSSNAPITLIISSSFTKVSLNVLSFPGASGDPYFQSDVPTYLYNNPTVNGATVAIEWGGSDPGGGQYDWSYPDSQIQPWIQAGKKANLVVWAVADNSSTSCGPEGRYGQSGTGNCAIPSYVWNALGSSNITSCTSQYGTQQMPNYFAADFQSNYKDFMAAVIQHYAQNPSIGYIRFGLGHGGESQPVAGWNDTTTSCGQAYVNAWGLSVASWEQYLASMLSYEGSLNSPVQLMMGVTPMGEPGRTVPDYAAPLAVQNGLGFGSQGLEASDVSNCSESTADWCSLFNEYAGQVPLELQTIAQSCPSGNCRTGSLVDLIPFAVNNYGTVFEIYYQDWLTAYDPNYPGYFTAYQAILQTASGTVN